MRRALFFSLLFLAVGCVVPMYKPIGLGIPASVSNTDIMNAVKAGMTQTGWTIEQRSDLELVGRFSQSDKMASVKVDYDPSIQVVSFTYLNSSNMKFVKGVYRDKIHSDYNLKLLAMEKAVALNLARLLVSGSSYKYSAKVYKQSKLARKLKGSKGANKAVLEKQEEFLKSFARRYPTAHPGFLAYQENYRGLDMPNPRTVLLGFVQYFTL